MTLLGLQREGDKTPGGYREGTVRIAQTEHLPPDGVLVPQYMQELVSFINRDDSPKYALMKVALAQHHFGWIHPFGNGNGRVVSTRPGAIQGDSFILLHLHSSRTCVSGDLMLTGFNHLTLAVGSLPRSIAFYTETLGFKLSARWKTGAYLSLGDLWLCLSSNTVRAEDMQRNYTHYAFSIDQKNFAEFSRRLRELKVPLWRQDKSEGDSHYFLDPDEHQLESHVGDLKSRLAACRRHPYSDLEIFD